MFTYSIWGMFPLEPPVWCQQYLPCGAWGLEFASRANCLLLLLRKCATTPYSRGLKPQNHSLDISPISQFNKTFWNIILQTYTEAISVSSRTLSSCARNSLFSLSWGCPDSVDQKHNVIQLIATVNFISIRVVIINTQTWKI